MKKYTLISMIREARKNFISESTAVKLADDFEAKAEKALANYFKEYPVGCFFSSFEFPIKSIDLSTCQCEIDRVGCGGDFVDVSEYDDWLYEGIIDDGVPVEAFQNFVNELKARGYEVGIDEYESNILKVYVSYEL